jgi:hypothetical protein
MGKVNIDFTPTKYNADDAPDLVTGAYNQSMDDLKTALDNATAEDSGGGDVTYPIPIDKGGTNATDANAALYNLAGNIPSQNSDIGDTTRFIIRYSVPNPTNGAFMYVRGTRVWDWIKTKVLEARKTVELTINIVDNEGEIDGHQIPKSEGTIIPLCVHGKHTATPVVFGFDVDEDDTNYLLYIYAQTKSQVDSINVVFEYLVL